MQVATRAAGLSDDAVRRGVRIAALTPSPVEWRLWMSATLAFFGSMLLLAAVIMFVAYNWSRIGRFGKFALIEIAIVAVTLIAWKKLPKLTGQISLFCASVLVGPLLVIYGQTYQTGADPYGLFLTWALLIVPWAIVARFGANWVLILLLFDVALGLYFAQILAPRSTDQALVYPLLVAAMHGCATILWELQLDRVRPWIRGEWALRVIGFVGFVALFFPAAYFVMEDTDAGLPGIVGLVVFVAAVSGCIRYYSRVRADRFMWTLGGVAGMGLLTVIAARLVFDLLDLEVLGLFVMAAVVVWQMTYGVKLYRRARAS